MALEESFLDCDDIHPIDIVETLAENNAWDFDRISEEQIAMAVTGIWRTYSISLAWSAYDETLRLMCSFDMDPPEARLPELYHILDLANDLCWSGAFTLWRDHKLMVYRYGLNLAGGATAGPEQIRAMLAAAIEACERFYPAFQVVCWGDENPEDAIKIALDCAYGTA